MSKPRITTLAMRYARALHDAATESEDDAPEEIQAELSRLNNIWNATPELRFVLGNSYLSTAWRADLCCELAGLKQPSIAAKLAEILIRGKRMPLLSSILAAWQALRREIAGITAVLVETPVPLPADLTPTFNKRLENIYGGPVELKNAVNPALLGGIVLRAKGRMIDGSLRGCLDNLRRHLLDEQLLTT